MCAYRRLLPPSTLMHITCRAPVLSATSSIVCIWIIAISNLTRLAATDARGSWRFGAARVVHLSRRPVLEPVRVKPRPAEALQHPAPAAGESKSMAGFVLSRKSLWPINNLDHL